MNIFVAFITGLTTGGLSCLAVQGGLLANSLAYQIEQDIKAQGAARSVPRKAKSTRNRFKPRIAQPIVLFLAAKLFAYTLLGFLLGALGSTLQLTPLMSAMLMIAIGVFMLGNGLRMLNVHPIFRYFVIEPPSFITRYIRRKSKNSVSLVTPLFLGLLTVLIPCGVAQTMMATALASGNALQGAVLLFAFTLGTTPIFFTVTYLATRLGARLEKYFTRIAAATVIVLGLVAVNSGLNVLGSPVSFTNLTRSLTGGSSESALSPELANPSPQDGYVINVFNDGYSPSILHLPANQAVDLNWITQNTRSCATYVVVPALNYRTALPKTGKVLLKIPAQKTGTVIRYSCSMGMYTGEMVFDRQ